MGEAGRIGSADSHDQGYPAQTSARPLPPWVGLKVGADRMERSRGPAPARRPPALTWSGLQQTQTMIFICNRFDIPDSAIAQAEIKQ